MDLLYQIHSGAPDLTLLVKGYMINLLWDFDLDMELYFYFLFLFSSNLKHTTTILYKNSD